MPGACEMVSVVPGWVVYTLCCLFLLLKCHSIITRPLSMQTFLAIRMPGEEKLCFAYSHRLPGEWGQLPRSPWHQIQPERRDGGEAPRHTE